MEWSLMQRKYQLWLAVPSKNRPRNLRNREEVAKALGVDVDTLLVWEASAGFWDDTFSIARALIGHRLADILEANAREAVRGSVTAMKLAYQVLGVASEKIEHKLSMEDDQLVIVMRNAPDSALTKPPAQASGTAPVQPNTDAAVAAAIASGLITGLVGSTIPKSTSESDVETE